MADGGELVAGLQAAQAQVFEEVATMVAADPEYWGSIADTPALAVAVTFQALIHLPDAARAVARYAEETDRTRSDSGQ